MLVLGAIVDQQQDGRRRDALTQQVQPGIGLAIEPVSLRLIVIDLVLDRDVVGECPLEPAANPQITDAKTETADLRRTSRPPLRILHHNS